jgi:arginine/lysine/ornithine decarboxylase
MNTPIVDYVKQYNEQQMTRVHMPGHKGRQFLGCEANDITEIKGADALYEAEGIIHESEKNAASLFGSSRTLYATEGSSQCIRAMLYLAVMSYQGEGRPIVLAARNVHKSFVQAAALVDVDVEWIFPEGDMHSICSCIVNAKQLEAHLQAMKVKPVAVYLTTPDYLGGVLELQTIADICHKYEVLLLVDNAHGAYLKFLEESKHPMDLGVDICCGSAHKTLPVLTGGAYLHLHHRVSHKIKKYAKNAMALFGSTSPSYLTLASLDLCNKYLADGYKVCLKETIIKVEKLRETLRTLDWQVEKTDPLKLTIAVPSDITGIELAEQ